MNENERMAMEAICADCDELDGWGFTRPTDMVVALVKKFNDGNVVGGYIADLMHKNMIDVDVMDDTVWVSPEIFAEYC